VVGNVPAAAWLGEPDRATVREAYMRLYNWSNMNILAALRSLCQRLVLKGETQQVDRVLDAFSCRWCDCNPSHGFKATGKC
jgi:Sec7-like guanine-nucleotide exchange factor